MLLFQQVTTAIFRATAFMPHQLINDLFWRSYIPQSIFEGMSE
jgi:hypothetical protein